MKLNDKGSGVKSNAEASGSLEFGIGDESVVIEILRNRLYGNPIQTLVQEYVCNARDASRELGTNRPIEIQIPKKEEPTFIVRDFGPGISPDRMANVFVKFGSSTKRENDTQTGGFGIGAKSAWAYSDSFSIITYIDGTRRSYLAHIGENRKGKLDLLSTDKTTESNGTEIRIAVQEKHLVNFYEAVYRAVYLWDVPPKITGFQIEHPAYYGRRELALSYSVNSCKLIKGKAPFLATKDHYNSHGGITFSVDDIPYRVEQWVRTIPEFKELSDYVNSDYSLILFFKTGEMEVSATRESIVESTFNEKQIREKAKAAIKEIDNKIQKDFSQAKTVPRLIETYKKSHAIHGNKIKSHTIKGKFGEYELSAQNWNIFYSNFNDLKVTSVDFKSGPRIDEDPAVFGLGGSGLTEFYYDDNKTGKEESKNLTRRRLKKYLEKIKVENLDVSNVYILKQGATSKDEFKAVAEEMGAVPLSTLTYDKPTTKNLVRKAEDKFFYYAYRAYSPGNGYGGGMSRSSNTTDPTETLPYKKYVYFIHDGNSVNHGWNEDHFAGFTFLLSRNMIGVVSVVESSLKKVKSHPQFISIKDFLANMDPSLVKAESVSFRISTAAAEHYGQGASLINQMKPLLNYYKPGMIKSKKLSESIEALHGLGVTLTGNKVKDAIVQLPLPVALAAKIADKDIKKEIDAIQYFVNEYNNSFLLLKNINFFKDEPIFLAEVIRYLNTRD